MKKIVYIICLTVALFSLPLSAAALDTVTTVDGYGPYQSGNGGEFTLLPAGSISGVSALYVAGVTGNIWQNGTFQSFCLENHQPPEYLYPNTTATAVLNDRAITGGVGLAGDKLSRGSAYLYYLFATQALLPSVYDYTGGGRKASALALQQAIWFLEDESGGSLNADYTNLLTSRFGVDAKLDNDGLYPVAVLNLWSDADHVGDLTKDGNGNYIYARQDQLVLNPVPEPMTMILFGLGLVGLAGLRRKNRE